MTHLSPRERQVMEMLAEGKANKEIARALKLRDSTVKWYVRALFRVLGVRNRTEVAVRVFRGVVTE